MKKCRLDLLTDVIARRTEGQTAENDRVRKDDSKRGIRNRVSWRNGGWLARLYDLCARPQVALDNSLASGHSISFNFWPLRRFKQRFYKPFLGIYPDNDENRRDVDDLAYHSQITRHRWKSRRRRVWSAGGGRPPDDQPIKPGELQSHYIARYPEYRRLP